MKLPTSFLHIAAIPVTVMVMVISANTTTAYFWNKTVVTDEEVVIGRKFAYGGRYEYAVNRRTGDEKFVYIDKRYFAPDMYRKVVYDPKCRCVSDTYTETAGESILLGRSIVNPETVYRTTGTVAFGVETIPLSDVEKDFAEANAFMLSYRERLADLLPLRR